MPSPRSPRIAGWILSGLIAAMLAGPSGLGKLTDWEGKAELVTKMGLSEDILFKIGIVEIAIAVLFLIPRTAFLGAVLLTGYLGGAVATHVRIGDSFLVPLVIGVLVWIGLGLRQKGVFTLAFGAADVRQP